MEDYARLPVLTKADIRANFDRLKARNLQGQLLYKATGGSTGEPLRFGYPRESYERRTAVMWRGYGWTGAPLGRRARSRWGGAVGEPSGAPEHKEKRGGASGWERGCRDGSSDVGSSDLVLTKADIRANFDRLKARNLQGQLLYKATGGSTGEPLRFGYTRESYERRTAVMWRGYGWTGATLGRRALYLWGGAVGEQSRATDLKERLYHAAFHRRILNSFLMREDNMAAYADAIAAYRPEVVVAYVDPVFRLSKWLLAQGRTIRGVGVVLGAAEALHDFQRPIIEAAFPGSRAYNTYGCREFMLIACEAGDRNGLLVNADHLAVELVDASRRSDGSETGKIATTDLHKRPTERRAGKEGVRT